MENNTTTSTIEKNSIDKGIFNRRVFKNSTCGEVSFPDSEEARCINEALNSTRERMGEFFTPRQILGRRETIGCVALEITQRCNLDCTLCYLSDNSENVKDLPLQEILSRLDGIKKEYGPGTVVQITGGDPTLRNKKELVEIVRYTRSLGLQPALFTNGIKLTRTLLEKLCAVGLMDVAFHVDLTQEREGYHSEKELNEIRKEYIERTKGLPLTVIFNTTVFEGNFSELDELITFFREQAHTVKMASFQLQADTGRGELTNRENFISQYTVRKKIERGIKEELAWNAVQIGHPSCHSFGSTFLVNNKVIPLLREEDAESLLDEALEYFRHTFYDRRNSTLRNMMCFLKDALGNPVLLAKLSRYVARYLWRYKFDLIKAKGKIYRQSFFIHDFMDASCLDKERVDACSFMVMTHEGPVSMCAHNAKRDEYILTPLRIKTKDGEELWQPLRTSRSTKIKARGKRSLPIVDTKPHHKSKKYC